MARETDIACDLDVFSVDERGEHIENTDSWRAAIAARQELADGYRFELERRDGLLEAIARFITLESRCCPFFSFSIEVPAEGPLALVVTGPEGSKEILGGVR
jgi:hypothetical protein